MPPPPLVLVESICFSTQCQPVDANWFVHFISSFGYFPVWLLMFNFLLGFVNLDLYYLIASKIAFTAIYYYVLVLATLMKYERPAGGNQFQKCGWQQYSFPDASFVTSMVYSLAVIFGFWVDRRIHRYLTRWHTFLMAVVISLYMASTIVTGYFSFEQLAANFFVALIFTFIFIELYQFSLYAYVTDSSKSTKKIFHRLSLWTGITSTVLTMYNTGTFSAHYRRYVCEECRQMKMARPVEEP